MEKKFNGNKFSAFLKKNGYLILMVICLAAIATLIVYAVIRNQNNLENGLVNQNEDVIPVIGDNKNEQTDGDKKDDTQPTSTSVTETPVLIAAPVETANVLKGYTETELVYNATMKHWATHQAIDYKTEVGAPVKAVFDGEVVSVSTSTLKGTTVVIKHAQGLESSYSLLGTDVKVKAGDKVKKGDVIGYVAETGIFETADGPHLHFELRKDGKLVDPELYSDSGNK